MNESDKISISGCVQLEAITINGYVYKWLPEPIHYKWVNLTYPTPDTVIAVKSDKPVFFIHDKVPDSTFINAILDKGDLQILRIPAMLEKHGDKETLTIDFLKATELEFK